MEIELLQKNDLKNLKDELVSELMIELKSLIKSELSELKVSSGLKKKYRPDVVAAAWSLSRRTVERWAKDIAKNGNGSMKVGERIVLLSEDDLCRFEKEHQLCPVDNYVNETKSRKSNKAIRCKSLHK